MSTPSTIPKFSELQDLVKDTIAAASYFKTLASDTSVKRHDDSIRTGGLVISDRGQSEKTIEKHLRDSGFVVAVQPLLGARLRDQSGPGWLANAEIMVKVMANPERNDASDGAEADIYDAVIAAINALCQRSNHPGGEHFKLASDAVSLSRFDPGLWVYDLLFTKEVLI